jgi:hypothetical protein
MKRRTVKKLLRLAERDVAGVLASCIKSATVKENILIDDEWSYLGFALGYLLTYHLSLHHPEWPHRQRWIDDIEWESISINRPEEVNGMGKLWWGSRYDIGGQMMQARIEVKLLLLGLRKKKRMTYRLQFTSDEILYRIENK